MKLHRFPVAGRAPADIFAALQPGPYSLFLDSSDTRHALGRYSFIAWQPFETIEYRDGRVFVTNSEQQLSLTADPFSAVQQRLAAWAHRFAPADESLPPFQGGAAGFFGYELAGALERLHLPHYAGDMPDMAIGLYDRVYAHDHETGKGWFIIHSADADRARAEFAHFNLLAAPDGIQAVPAGRIEWNSSHSEQQYRSAVTSVINHIRAGDIFQANLSQRFSASLPAGFDSFAHYQALRARNPAPFAAYLDLGAIRIASSSPERFLSVKDGIAETRPIKGTAARDENPVRDNAARAALLMSEKDRAENVMIVDLLRNDLAKVCTDDSVEVAALCEPESFARLHHLVSTVTGKLRDGQDALDLLRACFPGGSITGAPKVRAMEIIAELERRRRGPYCGAIGYIGANGAMDMNIAIRTLVYEGRGVSFSVGGGITAASDPEAEYRETLAKAAAIFGSFGPPDEKEVAA
jgi:para-aminobenzoate synthetase component 1